MDFKIDKNKMLRDQYGNEIEVKSVFFNHEQFSLWKSFRKDVRDSELSKEEQKVEIKKVYTLISLCRNNRALFDSLIMIDENIKYKMMPVITSHFSDTSENVPDSIRKKD